MLLRQIVARAIDKKKDFCDKKLMASFCRLPCCTACGGIHCGDTAGGSELGFKREDFIAYATNCFPVGKN